MRLAGLAPLVLLVAFGPAKVDEPPLVKEEQPARLAGLKESLPGRFVDVVNGLIQGRISTRRIEYRPPATLVLQDTVVTAPEGAPVLHVRRAEIAVAVSQLLVGNVVVKRIELEKPRLLLEKKGGELNLLRAFAPKKRKEEPGKPSEVEVRLEGIRVERGALRYRDEDNLAIAVDEIGLEAKVEIDVGDGRVVAEVLGLSATGGSVRLPELDVSLEALRVRAVRIAKDLIVLEGAEGRAVGAKVDVAGSLLTEGEGRLSLSGRIDAPPGTWPERLEPLPFPVPAVRGSFVVRGPFAAPTVEVDGAFDATEAFSYAVLGGKAQVEVTKEQVQIRKVEVRLPGGTASASGTLRRKDRFLDLEVLTAGLPLRTALGGAKLEEPLEGTLAGAVRLQGVADGVAPLGVRGRMTGAGVRGFSVVLPALLTLDVDGTVTRAAVTLTAVSVTGEGLAATLGGKVFLEDKRLSLTVVADAERATRLVPDLPDELFVARASFTGRVEGPFDHIVVQGDVKTEGITAYGVPGAGLMARLVATKERVSAGRIRGRVAGGALSGELSLRLSGRARALTGELSLVGAELAAVRAPDGKELPVAGRAEIQARLLGTADAPEVRAEVRAHDVTAAGERVGHVEGTLAVTKEGLLLESLRAEGPLGSAWNATPLALSFEAQSLVGDVAVRAADLSRVKAAEKAALKGRAQGLVRLGGTISRPDVIAWIDAEALEVFGELLGGGPLVARLGPGLKAKAASPSRLAQLSGRLVSARGALDLGAAFILDEEKLHATAHLVDFDLGSLLSKLPGKVAPLGGMATGQVRVWGTLDALNGRVSLRIPELVSLGAPPPSPEKGERGAASPLVQEMRAQKARGPVLIQASLEEGQLEARVCAFRGGPSSPKSPCPEASQLWLKARGSVDPRKKALDVRVEGRLAHDALEEALLPLQKKAVHLGLVAGGSARVRLASGADAPTVDGLVTLHAVDLEVEGAPRAELRAPSRIRFEGTKATLLAPLLFDVGEGSVRIAGSVGDDALDLELDGRVGLALLKLYVDELSQTSGTAMAKLRIKGAPASPQVHGVLSPDPGAWFTSRTLRQRVALQGGRVVLEPATGAEAQLLVRHQELRARVGEGSIVVDGDVVLDVSQLTSGVVTPVHWNLTTRGNSLFVRTGESWAEISFNLLLAGPRAAPRLFGQVELHDGLLRERFQLQNFVLSSAPGRPSTPLHEALEPVGLESLRLDVDVQVQAFRVRADLVSFPAEAVLVGNVRLENTVRLPSLAGAVEVAEGRISFPKARLDITEARIEFPKERTSLEPNILVVARGELHPRDTGCQAEVPVVLTLDGEGLAQLPMDLRAEETSEQHSRTELLAALLLGHRLRQCQLQQDLVDPLAAFRAVSGQLTADLTREIEEAVQRELGGDLQLSPLAAGGRVGLDYRLSLSRRLEIEGEAGVIVDASQLSGEDANRRTWGNNVRARLLLYDHLPPFGSDVFLEGGFADQARRSPDADTAVDLRLKLRIFEE